MSFINWHKNYVKKSLNMFGLSNYQGFWISFIKGLIFGAIIMWFVGCKEKVVIKNAPISNIDISTSTQSDYSIGVKGNCGMCKTTIEKAVKGLDFVKNAEWGIKTKILDVEFINSVNSNLDPLLAASLLDSLNSAINESGYETMNSTANQSSYDALPGCCKYDRDMQVYSPKSD
jgi:copper chaperone CopZ